MPSLGSVHLVDSLDWNGNEWDAGKVGMGMGNGKYIVKCCAEFRE